MILDRFTLTDSVAIVTGAGRGIGRAIALGCAEVGADVVCAARTAEQVEDTAARVRDLGRRALAYRCDVTKPDERQALVDAAVGELGRLDVLVNNVGGWPPQPLLETSDKDFERAFRFNVTHALSLTRLAAPHLARSSTGGSVVNISSVAGIEPSPSFAAYGTAKAALNYLTRELAQDLAPAVRVNAIACGSIETEALQTVLTDEVREQMVELTPMARLGTVDDIAACAVYLASPAASYVTGQIVGVHGGMVGLNMRMPRASP